MFNENSIFKSSLDKTKVQFSRKRVKIITLAVVIAVGALIAITVTFAAKSSNPSTPVNSSKNTNDPSNAIIDANPPTNSENSPVFPGTIGIEGVVQPIDGGIPATEGIPPATSFPATSVPATSVPATGGILDLPPPPRVTTPSPGITLPPNSPPPPHIAPPQAANIPAPALVSFGTISHGGSACPQGSMSQNFNADRTVFTFLFDKFTSSIIGERKFCQINIAMNVPTGWQYSMVTIDYRGYAKLDAGVTAEQAVTYYFQGEQKDTTVTTETKGPIAKSYAIRNTFPSTSPSWSPCGRSANLNIVTEVELIGADGLKGVLTTDSFDGQVKVAQQFGLVWKKC